MTAHSSAASWSAAAGTAVETVPADELVVISDMAAVPSVELRVDQSLTGVVVGTVLAAAAAGALAWGVAAIGGAAARTVGAVALLVLAPVMLSRRPPSPVRRALDLLGSVALLVAAVALLVPMTDGTGPAAVTAVVAGGAGTYAAVRAARRPGRRVLCLCSPAEMQRLTAAVASAELQYLPWLDGPVDEGGSDDLVELCRYWDADLVLLGAHRLGDPALSHQVARLYATDVRVRTVGEFIEEVGGRVPVNHLSVRWFLRDVMAVHNRSYRVLRYVVDLGSGAAGCLVLLALLPFLAVAIKLDSAGPVLYRQERVGRGGRTFRLVKLRSMRSDAEADGPAFAAATDPRVTRVGRFLRASRLDELPQLWNVLRGDMTIIGPRPERPEFIAGPLGQIPYYEFRHIVKPGVTGWAQVTEGYTSDVEGAVRKLERDLYYIRHQGVLLDVRVLVQTISCVLRLAGR